MARSVLTLDTNVNVVLLIANLDFSTCVFGFRERIEGLEVLDVCGHKTERGALLVLSRWCWVSRVMESTEWLKRR
jgi:hypothetical protein